MEIKSSEYFQEQKILLLKEQNRQARKSLIITDITIAIQLIGLIIGIIVLTKL